MPQRYTYRKSKGDSPMQSVATRRVLGISVSADASPEDVQTIRMATINVSVLILFFTIWVVFSITNGGNPYMNGINVLTLVGIIGCFIGGFLQKHPQFLKSLSCCTAYMVFNLITGVVGSIIIWSRRELQCVRCLERNMTTCIVEGDAGSEVITLNTTVSCAQYKMSNDRGTMVWLAFSIVHMFLFAGAGFFTSKLSSMSHFTKYEESPDQQPKMPTPIPVISSSMVYVQPNSPTRENEGSDSKSLNVSFT